MRPLIPLLLLAASTTACADDVLDLTPGRDRDAGVRTNEDAGRPDAGAVDSQTDAGTDVRVDGVTVAAGNGHACARMEDDVVRCWGANDFGALGDGTTEPRNTAVDVINLGDVVELSAGVAHMCARLRDDTVQCWGRNDEGALGNGNTTARPTPEVVANLTDVAQVSAGSWHTCALLHDGTIRCWGANQYGALGDGTTSMSTAPVRVALVDDAVEVAAGDGFTCVRRENNSVWCWGFIFPNALGSLDSDGNATGVLTPLRMDGFIDTVEISAGFGHLCARLRNRTMRCVGPNTNGELGDGTRTHRSTPVDVVDLDEVEQISLGGYSCALRTDGTVHCFGLGSASGSNAARPVEGVTDAVQIATGSSFGCARLMDRTIRCWGHNSAGQTMAGGCCHDGLCGLPEGTACGAPSDGGGVCTNGWCSGCGGLDQPCCDPSRAGGRCRTDTPLCNSAEVCVACGGLGEPCCGSASDSCRDEGAVCFNDACVLAGEPDAPCLANNVCTNGCCTLQEHGDRVCVGIGTMCPAPSGANTGACAADGSCGTCGGLSQPCCPAADSTRIPSYCSAPQTECATDVCVANGL